MNLHRQSFVSFAINLATVLANVAASVLVVRRLGPEGRGIYAVANSIAVLAAMLLNLGLPWANTYLASRGRHRVAALAGNSIAHALGATALLLAIAAAPIGLPVPGGKHRFLILALLCPALILFQSVNAILLGLGSVALFSQFAGLVYAAFLVLCLAVDALGLLTTRSMLACLALSYALLAAIALRRVLKRADGPPRFSGALLATAVRRVGAKAQCVNLLGAVMQRTDVFIVNHFHGEAAVGHYSLAVFVGQLSYQVPAVLGNVLFPLAAENRELAENIRRIGRLSRFMIILHLLLFAILLAAGGPLFSLLYGGAFSGCLDTLVVLYPGLIFASLGILLNSFLAGRGYPAALVGAASAGATLSLLLNLALVPRHAGNGAAAAFSVAYGAMFALLARHLSRTYGASLHGLLVPEPGELGKLARYFVRFEFLSRMRL